MVTNLQLSKTGARCSSSFTVSAKSDGTLYISSYASTDYDTITVTVPDIMLNATINSVTFTHTDSSNSGTKKIVFSDTTETVTNASILRRLKNGDKSFNIRFSFKASESTSSGTGTFTRVATWNSVTIKVDYTPLGKVTDTATIGTSSVVYSFKNASIAIGETDNITLLISPTKKVERLIFSMRATGETDYFSFNWTHSVNANTNMTVEHSINVSDIVINSHKSTVDVRVTLVYSDGTNQSSSWKTTEYLAYRERYNPVVTATFADTTDCYSKYGWYVRGESKILATLNITIDDTESGNVAVVRSISMGDIYIETANNTIDIATDNLYGDIDYTIRVEDSHGLVGEYSGMFTVTDYHKPVINELKVERYAQKIDSHGETYYELDDDSPTVWLTLEGLVAPLNERNAWTLKIKYGDPEIERTLDSYYDGALITYLEDRFVIPYEFSENKSWDIKFILSDTLYTTEYIVNIPKAGAILSIEKYGVAVGKRSTGTLVEPLFESAYKAVFDNGIYSGGTHVDYDSGWDDLTLMNSTAYNTNNHKPSIRRFGEIISMAGQIKLNASLANGSYVQILNLPSQYRPNQTLVIRCGGTISACDLWINAGGSVNLYNRSGAAISTSANISLACTFMR